MSVVDKSVDRFASAMRALWRRGRNGSTGLDLTAKGEAMTEQIRKVVAEYGRLSVDITRLSDGDDLYRAGLTSHASVNLMLAIEDAFDLEFPERFLRRGTFESIAAIRSAVEQLLCAAES